ncbi:Cysteine desulfurase [Castellaniella defragrans 65Phen]|uniref:Cysteine desulfurase n=2 Tax=Castellaniella defragrans TaxID=75697 RepID=W8X963_CASD6|nr:cysteine desulfurase [Castellaniella defragrans]KAB0622378.1 cysteine desulfurase [Castellaniella defragrans]MBB6083597.1 cysteine desulfurase/selenocysteine lyase [Castellaniella defragrans]CDM24275.1 Cysteine desulfurase [Castellaniella defragrans 65Phen]
MNAPLTPQQSARLAADPAGEGPLVSPWAADFPILARPVRKRRLAYLDNGATTQKPRAVIQAMEAFYEQSNANIHRGVHWLSQHATDLYEQARDRVRVLLNAPDSQDIVFTAGTTASINLVAQTWGQSLRPGDEILVTGMEHHSNIVPWQLLCARTGAVLRHARITDSGELDLDDFRAQLNPRTRLVGVAHVSNALGTVNPVAELVRLAHEAGALALVDGAQAVAHAPVDVQALDCDFYAFSGHKLYGPTGIGALYVRGSIMAGLPPWQGGGDMIRTVSFEGSTWADGPQRFEAGTPNIGGSIVMGAAIDYVLAIGLERIAAHEAALLAEATERMLELPGVRLVGTAAHKAGILSFLVDGIHPHDLGTILDTDGVAIRAGHHCAMPLMSRFGIPGTARASFALYNDGRDIDALVAGVRKAQKLFGVA